MRSIRSASPQSYTASAFDWVSLSTDARDARYRRSKVKVEFSTLTRRSPPHPSFGRAAMTMLRWLGSRLRTPAAAGIARVALGSGGPTRHPATFPPNILSPGSAFPVKAAPLALRCGWVGVGLGATVSGKLSHADPMAHGELGAAADLDQVIVLLLLGRSFGRDRLHLGRPCTSWESPSTPGCRGVSLPKSPYRKS